MFIGRRRPGITMRLRNTWRGLRARPPVTHDGVYLVDPRGFTPPVEDKPVKKRKEIPDNVKINYPLTKTFFRSIEKYAEGSPKVSIVILSYCRPDLVENLILSIWLHTKDYQYEIIVVDNGSPMGEHDLKAEFRDRVTAIRLDRNQYLGDAYNIGVEAARAPYIVLMNNDIVVEPNWLGPLIDPLETNPGIGATGPRFLYPTGQLQEAGALIDAEGYSVQLGKRGNAEAPEFNKPREIDYCTGATIALRREGFLDTLGYDWRWSPGYYEDVDLCLKLKERGQGTYYFPQSTVFHIESATMVDMPPSSNLGSAIDTNRQNLVAKWHHLLGTHRTPHTTTTVSAQENLKRFEYAKSEIDRDRPTIGVYFQYEFIPGGGEKFALSIAEEFSDEAQVVIVFENQQSILRVMSVITDLGFDKMDFKCVTRKEAERMPPFDVFLLQGNELFPTKKGLGRKNYFICQFPFPTNLEYLEEFERLGLYNDYTSYIVYSDYVKKHVRAQLASWREVNVDINVIPPTCDDVGLGNAKKTNQVIGVGRFFTGGHNKRHDIMIDALQRSMEKAPDIDINLCLVGASHKEAVHREHLAMLRTKALGLPIKFHVDELRDRLDDHYRRSKVYYHAAGWGVDDTISPHEAEHFGISLIEAMSAGCVPIVYGVGGPAEIVNHGINGVIISSVDEMADWTIRILKGWDTPIIMSMRENALVTAKAYGKEAFGRIVREIVSFPHNEVKTLEQ